MTAKAVIAADEPAEAVDPNRKAPMIEPGRVLLDQDGFYTRRFFVRLPQTFRVDDLKETAPWSKVQNGAVPLRKFDSLILVAWDESWIAEAIVATADPLKAVLAGVRITTLPTRFDRLPEDDRYLVVWSGRGFQVQRKADSVMMSQPVQSQQMAEKDLRNLYPRVLGQ